MMHDGWWSFSNTSRAPAALSATERVGYISRDKHVIMTRPIDRDWLTVFTVGYLSLDILAPSQGTEHRQPDLKTWTKRL